MDMEGAMKKNIIACLLIPALMALSACASLGIKMKGKEYFTGKTENDLIKYFGYEGYAFDEPGEYDRAVYFTNQVDTIEMSKTTVQRYKTSNSQNVFSFTFSERNDGCLVYSGNYHITRYNNEINRLNAVSRDNQQVAFNNTKIGSWFFVYGIDQKAGHDSHMLPDHVNEGVKKWLV